MNLLMVLVVLLLPTVTEARFARGNVAQRWHRHPHHEVAPPQPSAPASRTPRRRR
jgi:hypothetical protein